MTQILRNIAAGFLTAMALSCLAEPTLQFVDDPTKGALIVRETIDGQTTDVLCYNYGFQLPEGVDPSYTRSSYIHPLYSLDGEIVTDDFPADHLHHHGVWWGWPIVETRQQKVSNWAPTTPTLRHQFVRWTERQEGSSATFSAENHWMLDGQTTVAIEQATITVHPRKGDSRHINIDLKIEAVGGPMKLLGAPEQNKGYGGFSFRGAPELKGVPVLTDEGSSKKDLVYVQRRWTGLANDRYGIRIIAGENYPEFPPRWLARNSYTGYLNISWPGLEPATLHPGKPVTLTHELVIERGSANQTSIRGIPPFPDVSARLGVPEWKMGTWKTELLRRAGDAGFLDARIADARPDAAAAAIYREWINAGYHGEMTYLERLLDERTAGLDHVLPGARSIIVFAAPYYHPDPVPVTTQASARGAVRVARYALGVDYHFVLKDRLRPIIQWLQTAYPGHDWRATTDSAPVMERTYAAASGLGFIGKNGMLISWMQGSFTLLASIITTAELEPDLPRPGTCGQCTRCMDACPTQAILKPGILDARRCISYLTIEKKSQLSADETAATGDWAFGCDICQDVCPYNKSPALSQIPEFAPGRITHAVEPVESFLAPESNSQFERRFSSSPILRAGRRRVQKLVLAKKV